MDNLSCATPTLRVESRLLDQHKINREKRERKVAIKEDKEMDGCSFKPQIN